MKTTWTPMWLTQRRSVHTPMLAFAGIAFTGMMVACSGNSNVASHPSPVSSPQSVIQISMGDAPADWMVAFSMDITSMTINGSNGSVSAVTTTTPTEMMHLMGTMQPLAMMAAPQGSYTGASISIGGAKVMYVDPATKTLMQKTINGPITAPITFSNPIAVGATAVSMGFDLDLANSVTIDGMGNMAFVPVFHVTSGAQGSSASLDPSSGGIQEMMGTVSGISGSSFTMTSLQAAQSFTFATKSTTSFDNISNVGMMGSGMLLGVDATMQSDGTLMATHISSRVGAGGVMGGGVLVAVTGQPATQLKIVMQNGAGNGMMASLFAGGVTVNLSGSTSYRIDKDNIDLTNLPFTPVFDGGHIYAGQRAMPISSGGMMSGDAGTMMGGKLEGGAIAASEIELQQQGLSGAVGSAIASGATSMFKMTLPSDSAFGALTGAANVTVYQQPGTRFTGPSSIAVGTNVHVQGLLFLDAGQWKLVASRVGPN